MEMDESVNLVQTASSLRADIPWLLESVEARHQQTPSNRSSYTLNSRRDQTGV